VYAFVKSRPRYQVKRPPELSSGGRFMPDATRIVTTGPDQDPRSGGLLGVDRPRSPPVRL
jgi:hypothetical protein